MFPPAILLVSRWSAPESRGSAVGGFNLAGSFGFALGPLLGGWVYANWGFAPAFVLCGAIEIVAAAVGWWVVRRWPAET
jgi:MFS family permease